MVIGFTKAPILLLHEPQYAIRLSHLAYDFVQSIFISNWQDCTILFLFLPLSYLSSRGDGCSIKFAAIFGNCWLYLPLLFSILLLLLPFIPNLCID